MNDKEFLERIKTAYQVYPNQSQEIKSFISWLYRQYGIIETKDKVKSQ